ncbi:divergent polysaccharide deacetylase family protein [Epibacterium sp. MM17-32]|uniref:divergent polysaccharide deacteylase family protein n=1 Tax=Epibacterium sp. MM17-32 TaxID=2917734 RepID=UPI001EF4B1B5|nr:divergent polysaccharide deacetylase family protein [Epibacterium sp. MM17-32]MCG7626596.1 divergent polysaccharide deacetylase family protein [Epibacterium sp. MM17-32]
MRGFLGGVSVGALVATAGAAVWSLSTPLPPGVDVSGDTPAPILAPRDSGTLPQETPGSDADLVETAPAAPDQGQATESETAVEIDTESADQPDVSTEVTGPDATDPAPQDAEPPAVQPEQDAPVTGSEGAVALAPPVADTDPQPDTGTAAAPPSSDEVGAPSLDTPDAETGLPGLDAGTADVAPQIETATPSVQTPDIGTSPGLTPPDSFSGTAPVPPVPAPDTSADADEAADEAQRIADLPQASDEADPADDETSAANSRPRIGTPVVPLTERDAATAAEADTAAPEADAPPFVRNGEPATPAPGLPLMSIILVEEEGAVGAEALAEFPYPLTFAIDPADPEAAARMQARRAAGFEVMVLADLPRDAGPQDAETALPIWFDRLPESVGLLEGVDSGVQGNRPLADQVSAIAADLGYGLVLQDNGLNTVQKMALRDGVPAGVVFRDFDGAGQDPRAMRRFLDQAAFRAGQEGAVIMLGRLKPDTISALLIWGLQDRASRVELVPVSASLKRLLEPVSQ